jgi:hypothetical protein
MAMMIQIDIEALSKQHEQLVTIEDQLEDLLREAGPAERQVAVALQRLAREMLDQMEDVLDSEASRAAMDDVRLRGAVAWEDVEAELGR